MTTLWARMLVFEEYKRGRITEKCAQYFDSILNDSERTLNLREKDQSNQLNGMNVNCVLGNLGAVKYKRNNEIQYRFDVLKYINATTFRDGVPNDTYSEPAYLANILGEDYLNLDNEILTLIRYSDIEVPKENLVKIVKYLQETYDLSAKKDVSRFSESLINRISNVLQTLEDSASTSRN